MPHEVVNVQGKSPAFGVPPQLTPQQLISIVLGSDTQAPTGMYLSPELQDPKARQQRLAGNTVSADYPNIARAWEDVKQQYPFPASASSGVKVMWPLVSKLLGKNTEGVTTPLPFDHNYIFLNPDVEGKSPEDIKDTLVHELSHVSQYQNIPGFFARRDMIDPNKEYLQRPQEEQAYDTQFARRAALINKALQK